MRTEIKVLLLTTTFYCPLIAPSFAQTITSNSLQTIANRSSLFGVVDTPQHTLQDNGIKFFSTYFSTEAANPSGGFKQTNGYTQTLSLGMQVNLGKLAGIEGGQLNVVTSGRIGSVPLSSGGIGNLINVQGNVTGGNSYRMVELSYEQSFDDKKFTLGMGYLPMGNSLGNDYFGTDPGISYFEDSAFNLHPPSDFLDSGWLSYPLSSWGGYLRGYFAKGAYAEIGAWEVNPTNILPQNGFAFSIKGATGVEIPAEIRVTHSFGPSHLTGVYDIGGYYDTSSHQDIADSAVTVYGRIGGYLQAYQMLYRNASVPNRTLSAFFQVAGGSPKTGEVPGFFAAGLVKQGTFPGRNEDILDFGAYAAMVNSRLIAKEQHLFEQADNDALPLQLGEYGLDVSYTIRAARWLYVSPNIEYIINPGAFSYKHIPNATVIGVNIVASVLG